MTKEEFEVDIYPILAKYQIENSALVSEDIWQVFKPEQDRILKIVTDYAVRSSPTDENVRARKSQLESDFQKMKDGMNGEIEKLRIEVSNLNVEIARLKEMAEAAKKQARPLLNVLNDKITELEDYIFTGHAKGRRIKEAIRQRNMIKDISNFNDAK